FVWIISTIKLVKTSQGKGDHVTGVSMPPPAETSLTAVLVLATAVWIGGLGRARHLGRGGVGDVLPWPGPRVRAGRRSRAGGRAGQRGRAGFRARLERAADRQRGGRGGPRGRDRGRSRAGQAHDPAAPGRVARTRPPRAHRAGAQ